MSLEDGKSPNLNRSKPFQRVNLHQEDSRSSSRLWIDADDGNHVVVPEKSFQLFKDLIICFSAKANFKIHFNEQDDMVDTTNIEWKKNGHDLKLEWEKCGVK